MRIELPTDAALRRRAIEASPDLLAMMARSDDPLEAEIAAEEIDCRLSFYELEMVG